MIDVELQELLKRAHSAIQEEDQVTCRSAPDPYHVTSPARQNCGMDSTTAFVAALGVAVRSLARGREAASGARTARPGARSTRTG